MKKFVPLIDMNQNQHDLWNDSQRTLQGGLLSGGRSARQQSSRGESVWAKCEGTPFIESSSVFQSQCAKGTFGSDDSKQSSKLRNSISSMKKLLGRLMQK